MVDQRQQVAEERRAHILARFAEGFTADEIASELKINVRSVYRHAPRGHPNRGAAVARRAAEIARKLVEEERYPIAEACRVGGCTETVYRRYFPEVRLTQAEVNEAISLNTQARKLYARIDAGKIIYRLVA